ncbi:MAG TPA: helix-turn-helix transcriptional regulator [Longimicrobium sp.]|jgi:HTH-type transcriptional regulator/antitoxin HipB|uniref:helix-turn-helix domain-containing protein n=1 Tax=Longimicrobium sp. TaxID=2029185 RepID=UPI002EDAFFB7
MKVKTIREIGLLARAERKRLGVSLQAVAERAGCTRQWVAALEAGGERLEVALVLRTLAVLGIHLDAHPSSGQERS